MSGFSSTRVDSVQVKTIIEPPVEDSVNKGYLLGKYFAAHETSLSKLKHLDFLCLNEPGLRKGFIKNLKINVRLLYLNDQFHKAYELLTKCVEFIQTLRKGSADPDWVSQTLFSLHNYRLLTHYLRQIKLQKSGWFRRLTGRQGAPGEGAFGSGLHLLLSGAAEGESARNRDSSAFRRDPEL